MYKIVNNSYILYGTGYEMSVL